jgi:hypothetical protein
VNRVYLESKALASAAYSSRRRILDLEFRSGAVYRYFDFPRQQYEAFLAADSRGGYFSRKIRDRFRCQQIRVPRR